MIKKPPLTEQAVTIEQMNSLYIEHNIEAMLPHCKRFTIEDRYFPEGHPSHSATIHKHGCKYRLGDVTIAVIFHYTHIDKTITRHLRMLRIGDTKYSVAKMPPVHPQKV